MEKGWAEPESRGRHWESWFSSDPPLKKVSQHLFHLVCCPPSRLIAAKVVYRDGDGNEELEVRQNSTERERRLLREASLCKTISHDMPIP